MHPVARDVETTDDDSTVAPDYNVSLLQAPQSPQVSSSFISGECITLPGNVFYDFNATPRK